MDTFEGWCMRNVNKPSTSSGSSSNVAQPSTSKATPKIVGTPTYRMTANLRMALKALDDGVEMFIAARTYGIPRFRLQKIHELEIKNPTWVYHREYFMYVSLDFKDFRLGIFD